MYSLHTASHSKQIRQCGTLLIPVKKYLNLHSSLNTLCSLSTLRHFAYMGLSEKNDVSSKAQTLKQLTNVQLNPNMDVQNIAAARAQ